MTIEKITQSDIKPLDQVDKINEIITNNVYQNKVYAYKAAGYKIYEGSTSNLVATASSSDVYICYSRFSKVEDITSNAFYSDTACTSRIFHLTGYSPYYEAGNSQLSFMNKTDGLFRAYCYTPQRQYRLVFEFERYATGDVTNSGLIDWEGNDIDVGDFMKKSDLDLLYPVGSIYIGTQATCPLATLISGSTWELVAADRVLQGSSTNHAANTTIAAGLPNITGGALTLGRLSSSSASTTSGAITRVATDKQGTGYYNSTNSYNSNVSINARNSSTIYGNSSTVQPPAYVVNVWRRTA